MRSMHLTILIKNWLLWNVDFSILAGPVISFGGQEHRSNKLHSEQNVQSLQTCSDENLSNASKQKKAITSNICGMIHQSFLVNADEQNEHIKCIHASMHACMLRMSMQISCKLYTGKAGQAHVWLWDIKSILKYLNVGERDLICIFIDKNENRFTSILSVFVRLLCILTSLLARN